MAVHRESKKYYLILVNTPKYIDLPTTMFYALHVIANLDKNCKLPLFLQCICAKFNQVADHFHQNTAEFD